MTDCDPILVVTCGNELIGGDVLGSCVASLLQETPLEGLEVVALGTNPTTLVDHLAAGRERLILVDAIDDDTLSEGEIIELDYFDPRRPTLVSERALSTHGLSAAQQLRLAEGLGLLPPSVTLIGAAFIPTTDPVQGVPVKVQSAAKAIASRIRRLVGMFTSAQPTSTPNPGTAASSSSARRRAGC